MKFICCLMFFMFFPLYAMPASDTDTEQDDTQENQDPFKEQLCAFAKHPHGNFRDQSIIKTVEDLEGLEVRTATNHLKKSKLLALKGLTLLDEPSNLRILRLLRKGVTQGQIEYQQVEKLLITQTAGDKNSYFSSYLFRIADPDYDRVDTGCELLHLFTELTTIETAPSIMKWLTETPIYVDGTFIEYTSFCYQLFKGPTSLGSVRVKLINPRVIQSYEDLLNKLIGVCSQELQPAVQRLHDELLKNAKKKTWHRKPEKCDEKKYEELAMANVLDKYKIRRDEIEGWLSGALSKPDREKLSKELKSLEPPSDKPLVKRKDEPFIMVTAAVSVMRIAANKNPHKKRYGSAAKMGNSHRDLNRHTNTKLNPAAAYRSTEGPNRVEEIGKNIQEPRPQYEIMRTKNSVGKAIVTGAQPPTDKPFRSKRISKVGKELIKIKTTPKAEAQSPSTTTSTSKINREDHGLDSCSSFSGVSLTASSQITNEQQTMTNSQEVTEPISTSSTVRFREEEQSSTITVMTEPEAHFTSDEQQAHTNSSSGLTTDSAPRTVHNREAQSTVRTAAPSLAIDNSHDRQSHSNENNSNSNIDKIEDRLGDLKIEAINRNEEAVEDLPSPPASRISKRNETRVTVEVHRNPGN